MAKHVSTQRPGGCAEVAELWLGLAERIVVCGRELREVLRRLAARQGLSEPEISTLWACLGDQREGMDQRELASRLAISAAQVSGLVESLRAGGLLAGHRDQRDRRRQVWRLTPAGQAALRTAVADLADWAGRLEQRLQAGSSATLTRALDELLAAFDEPLGASVAAAIPPTSPRAPREGRKRGAA